MFSRKEPKGAVSIALLPEVILVGAGGGWGRCTWSQSRTFAAGFTVERDLSRPLRLSGFKSR